MQAKIANFTDFGRSRALCALLAEKKRGAGLTGDGRMLQVNLHTGLSENYGQALLWKSRRIA